MSRVEIYRKNLAGDEESHPKPIPGSNSETICVLIAEDNARVRAGVRALLEAAPDIRVVGEAKDGGEALELAFQLEPDVLILDMEMPVLTGVQVAAQLQSAGSEVRILALSAYDDQQYILGLIERGAYGYLIKEEVLNLLLPAVRGVAQGERGWLSERIKKRLENRMLPNRRERSSGGEYLRRAQGDPPRSRSHSHGRDAPGGGGAIASRNR
jgi:DNA-binding NarL/FixJ family response regulator